MLSLVWTPHVPPSTLQFWMEPAKLETKQVFAVVPVHVPLATLPEHSAGVAARWPTQA